MEGSILYLSLFFPTPLNFRRSLATFYIPSPTLHSIAILHDECKGMLWLCSPPRNALLMINMHFSAFSTLEISTLLLSDTALLWKPTYLPLGQLKVDQQNNLQRNLGLGSLAILHPNKEPHPNFKCALLFFFHS